MAKNPGALDRAHANPTPPTHYLFHPTLAVNGREAVETFFNTVFGFPGIYQREIVNHPSNKRDPRDNPDYPIDYSYYVWLADCWFDAIDPTLITFDRTIVPNPKPRTLYRLLEFGWHVADVAPLVKKAEEHNIRVINQAGTPVTSDHPEIAHSMAGPGISLFWLRTEDAGLPVELAYFTPEKAKQTGPISFPPMVNGWIPERPAGDNWLGIEYCSHHTFLTDKPERSLRWSVGVLGGRKIHEGLNDVLETDSTYVWLGQTVLEFGKPRGPGSASWAEFQNKAVSGLGFENEDVYHEITFKVEDLGKARAHIKKVGVNLVRDDHAGITIDPKEGLGVRWTFIDSILPGDPRG